MMNTRVLQGAFAAALSLTMAACSNTPPAAEAPAPEAAADTAASHEEHAGGGRVFFASPKNGETVKSPVNVEFGSDMFTIAAVPAGEVTEVRANTGHFHLGVDADCLPAGAVIPKADPWIHFGTGSNKIEQVLAPGTHKLSVQAGDDKHATTAGLCETITITVTE
jgi:hypothetical protein